jgi:hypothetical protein
LSLVCLFILENVFELNHATFAPASAAENIVLMAAAVAAVVILVEDKFRFSAELF